jgi:hypothetical protein
MKKPSAKNAVPFDKKGGKQAPAKKPARAKKSASAAVVPTKESSLATKIDVRKIYVPKVCPPVPDLSDYIRKDSIPCYGCNLK